MKKLSLIVATLTTLSLASLAPPGTSAQDASPGSDWPRILGPTADGKSPETGILTDWPTAGPPLVWEQSAGEGYAGPVIADGRLFLFDRRDDQARLRAMDARTGDLLWTTEYTSIYDDYYQYSRGPRAAPVVDGDLVFTFGVEGRLRATRVTDGELQWEVDTVEQFGVVKNFFGVGSSPIVEGDLLIAMVGGSPPDSPRIHSGEVAGNGSGIVAFDKTTGEVRYSVSDELASYASPVIATIGDRRWGFMFARGGLVGFEPTSGEIDFHFPWKSRTLESVNASSPVVVGDTVFISETYGPGAALLRVEPGGYEVIWQDGRRDQAMATHFGNHIYLDGTLYGSHGRNSASSTLRAIDYATGEVRWDSHVIGWSSLLYADGHLIVLAEDGQLLLVDPTPEELRVVASSVPARADGTPLLAAPSWSPPVLSHGLLYLRGKDRLIALELIPGS